jgi:AcrR family transcriptional regulator
MPLLAEGRPTDPPGTNLPPNLPSWSMAKKTVRSYYSLVRQKQADETRARIATAARQLILEKGYEAATMEAIAREAGVATPTVYVVFGSKRRILTELVDRAAFGPVYQDLVGEVMDLADPIARLRMAPRIARQIYDAERSELDLLRLRSGLDEKEARDLLWTLTGRDIYRMLVIERKWSSERHEKWLSDTPCVQRPPIN